jgi:hypothetical protein
MAFVNPFTTAPTKPSSSTKSQFVNPFAGYTPPSPISQHGYPAGSIVTQQQLADQNQRPAPVASNPNLNVFQQFATQNPVGIALGKVGEKVTDLVNKAPEAHFADKENFFTPIGFIKSTAQGLLNTPQEAGKAAASLGGNAGAGTSTPQQVLGDIAAAAQLPLLILSGGLLSGVKEGAVLTAKNIASQGIKATAKQGVKEVAANLAQQGVKGIAKNTVKQGIGGGAFGILSGLQSGKNIDNPTDYIKNLLVNIGVGAASGAALSIPPLIALPLAKGLSASHGAIFVKTTHGEPTIQHVQMSPEVAQNVVLANGLESKPVGKEILKQSIIAKTEGKQVLVTPTEKGGVEIGNGGRVNVSTVQEYNPSLHPIDKVATINSNGQEKTTTQSQVLQETNQVQVNQGESNQGKTNQANQANQVPEPQTKNGQVASPPSTEGESPTKTSKLGLKVETTAVEKKLTQDLGDLPDYKTMNMADQAQKATDLITSDPEKAWRVALGQEETGSDLRSQSVFKALEASISTPEDAIKLANSPLVSEASALGQKIKALDVQTTDSPVENIKSIVDARAKAVEKKSGLSVDKAIAQTEKEIKARIKTPDKYEWSSFLESIKC